MIAIFLIVAAYAALIYETGAIGVALAAVHLGVMAAAAHRKRRSGPQ